MKNKKITELDKIIGKNIAIHRKKITKLSRQNFAKKFGGSFQQLRNYEQGLCQITLNQLVKFCEIFEIGNSELLPESFFAKKKKKSLLVKKELLKMVHKRVKK